jgi:hypothetical protein
MKVDRIGEQKIFNFTHCSFHDISSRFHDDVHYDHNNDWLDNIFPAELSNRMGNRVHRGIADQLANPSSRDKIGEQTYDEVA